MQSNWQHTLRTACYAAVVLAVPALALLALGAGILPLQASDLPAVVEAQTPAAPANAVQAVAAPRDAVTLLNRWAYTGQDCGYGNGGQNNGNQNGRKSPITCPHDPTTGPPGQNK